MQDKSTKNIHKLQKKYVKFIIYFLECQLFTFIIWCSEIEAIITKAIDSIMAEDVRFNITGKTTLDEIKQMSNMGMITSAIDNVINPNFKIQIKVNSYESN